MPDGRLVDRDSHLPEDRSRLWGARMQRLVAEGRKALSILALFTAAAANPFLSLHAQPPENVQPSPDTNSVSHNEPIFHVRSSKCEMRIVERFAKVVELDDWIKRVDGFDPAIISVASIPSEPSKIRVQAVAPGITTMVVVDKHDNASSVEVFVVGDVRHLQAYINQLFPRASVKAVAIREDAVVLRGWVQQPEHITEIVELSREFRPNVLNQMRVGGVQQVQLKVRMMEVQRGRIRQMGFNFLYANQNGLLASTPGQLVPLTAITAPFGGPPTATANQTLLSNSTITGAFVNDNNAFLGFLEALKQESLLKILAEPVLVTTNGRPANMLAGGEFPVLVPQSLGTTTIEWREFGIRLEAVPILLGGGRIRLELRPEVSDRDESTAIQTAGFTVPGVTSRRVNTQVEMKLGETFLLAGLISTRRIAKTDKVPLLGEIPWLGWAFRRVRYEDTETELLIMVTPDLVSPLDECHVPKLGPGMFTDMPTDRELFNGGLIEVPRLADECEGCGILGSGPIGPGSHPIADPGSSFYPGITPPAPLENDGASPSLAPMPDEARDITLPPPSAPVLDGNDAQATRRGKPTASTLDGSTTRFSTTDLPSRTRRPAAERPVFKPTSEFAKRARSSAGGGSHVRKLPGLLAPQPGLLKPEADKPAPSPAPTTIPSE